jgi:hypothetical protein
LFLDRRRHPRQSAGTKYDWSSSQEPIFSSVLFKGEEESPHSLQLFISRSLLRPAIGQSLHAPPPHAAAGKLFKRPLPWRSYTTFCLNSSSLSLYCAVGAQQGK